MRKNSKIIQISGLRGLLFAVFVVTCLIAGFVVFPGFGAMYLWNITMAASFSLPVINIFQGILLWLIAALIFYLTGGSQSVVQFKSTSQLSDYELKELMSRIKKQNSVDKQTSVGFKSCEIKEINKTDTIGDKISQHEKDKEKL